MSKKELNLFPNENYSFPLIYLRFLFHSGRSQSNEIVGDEDQTDSKHKKNSQTDLTTQKSRNPTDLRNAAKESGKSERTSTGTKRKALNSRSGKYPRFFLND